MFIGLLIVAVLSATVVTGWTFVIGAPLWIVLIAYVATGVLVMLLGALAISLCGVVRRGSAPDLPHLPVQRNTTPTVAASTLASVAKDKARS